MIIGPASAMIEALGWITVMLPIVMSPRNSHSLQTIAPGAIFTLKIIITSASKLHYITLHYITYKIFIGKSTKVSVITVSSQI
jgi:hypothetical protein